MNVGELFVTLGFNADTVKLKDFARAIGDLPLDAAAAITALAGIEFELQKIAQDAINTAVGFQMFTAQTGLSWQELQRWQIVAEQANVSVDNVAQSVNSLQRNLAEIRLGRGNIAPFQLLGIGVNQNAFGVLEQLRVRIRGLDRATATNLITQMGLTPDMIQVLSLTDSEFAKLGKTISGITGSQEGSFLRARQELVQLGQVARYVGFDVIDHLVTGFEMASRSIANFKGILIGIGIVLVGVAAAFWPITAALVALTLIIDDLSVYFQGGNSAIGMAIKGIEKLAAALQDAIPGMRQLNNFMAITKTLGVIVPGILPMMAQTGMAHASTVNQTNNIHVHSSASAHDVGKAVKHEIDKGVAQANYQTNNQGY